MDRKGIPVRVEPSVHSRAKAMAEATRCTIGSLFVRAWEAFERLEKRRKAKKEAAE